MKKFRGRMNNGEFISGCLYQRGSDAVIDDGERVMRVAPDSLAELIGYDANGTELYAGDEVIDNRGTIFRPRAPEELTGKAVLRRQL